MQVAAQGKFYVKINTQSLWQSCQLGNWTSNQLKMFRNTKFETLRETVKFDLRYNQKKKQKKIRLRVKSKTACNDAFKL